jgi:glutamyl-tRNA reductase
LTEAVYLVTCNRVEVAFVADAQTPLSAYRGRIFESLAGRRALPGEAERTFRAWGGEGAVEHLFLVTAGLDSARVGENEICGQVRKAYELSHQLSLAGPRLELLFEAALKVARRVHHVTGVSQGRQSLAEIALAHVRRRLRSTPGAVALVGVSSMTERCAQELARDRVPILLVNRSVEHAEALARAVGCKARSLSSFRAEPDAVEALVLATGAPEAVLERADLERLAARSASGQAPLVVDMAIPADVAPEAALAAGVPRVGMEEILAEAQQSSEQRRLEMAEARAVVDEALIEFHRRLADRLLAPLLAAVQLRYRQTALEGVERLLRKQLLGFNEPQRSAVRRWAETLARRFAHLPTMGLRGVAYEAGSAAVEAFFAHASDPQLLQALRQANGQEDSLRLPAPDQEGGE